MLNSFQMPFQSIYFQKFPWGSMPPDPPSLACYVCLAHAVEYHMKADNLKITSNQ